MKYDNLPTTGSWWPYFDFTDGIDSNLVLLPSLSAMRALNAAVFERRLFANGFSYSWTANEYYNAMKNAARGVSIVPGLGISPIYELHQWTRDIDSAISYFCGGYFDIDADNYSEITPDDFVDYRYTFNSLLNKACGILDMEPIPHGNTQRLTPYFLKEYALQRYVMLNLCKVSETRGYSFLRASFEGVSVDEFLHGTPEEDSGTFQHPGWETWYISGEITSYQRVKMFYFGSPGLLYANCPCYEYYHINSLNYDFGTGMASGWNHRASTGGTMGVFQFNRDVPPNGDMYFMTLNDATALYDVSSSFYFYTDVENS